MKNFIQKYNIEDAFKELPPENQQALLESTWEKQLWDITKKHGMLIDESENIAKEVGLVLLGVEPTHDLQDNIERHADISSTLAATLIREINLMIFIPMRDKIQELQQQKKRGDLLSQIEDKPEIETVAHKKLAELFSIAPGKSDYSLDTPQQPVSYPKGKDPYHEPID